MINSYFTNNTANRDGGAINMDSGTVSNCNFTNNTATGTGNYDGGGAVYFYKGTGSVTNSNLLTKKYKIKADEFNHLLYFNINFFDYLIIVAIAFVGYYGFKSTFFG